METTKRELQESFRELLDAFNQHAEEIHQMREQLYVLDRAFESNHIGMCLVDMEGHFIKVNYACCEIWERSEEDLLRLTFQEITHPDDLKKDVNQFHDVLAGKITNYSMAKRYLMPNGEYKPCWLEVSTIPSPSGGLLFYYSKILSKDFVDAFLIELEKFDA